MVGNGSMIFKLEIYYYPVNDPTNITQIGDILLGDETQETVTNKVKRGKKYLVYVK